MRAIRVELKDYPPSHELQAIENDTHYMVEIDNERVRVLRIRLGPREKLRVLNLGLRVLVTLSDSGAQHSGDSHWADSGQEPISNPGDRPF